MSLGHAKILKSQNAYSMHFFFSLGVYREFKCFTHHSIDFGLQIESTSVYNYEHIISLIRTHYFFRLDNDQLGCLYLNVEYINRGELIISIYIVLSYF